MFATPWLAHASRSLARRELHWEMLLTATQALRYAFPLDTDDVPEATSQNFGGLLEAAQEEAAQDQRHILRPAPGPKGTAKHIAEDSRIIETRDTLEKKHWPKAKAARSSAQWDGLQQPPVHDHVPKKREDRIHDCCKRPPDLEVIGAENKLITMRV